MVKKLDRRVGMSRYGRHNAEPLLKTIAGSTSTRNAANRSKPLPKKEVADTDPPLSSDDEDCTDSAAGDEHRIPSSSGDEEAPESDIRRTRFGASSKLGKRKREDQAKDTTNAPSESFKPVSLDFACELVDSSPPAKRASIRVPTDGDDHTIDTILSDGEERKDGPSPVYQVDDIESSPQATVTVCPWCGAAVDKSSLDTFSKGRQMNVRLLKKFCHNHKKKTAEETWQAMKYPEVDWKGLVDRFKTHHSHLLGIIDGKESYYRNNLAAKIERGEARSMKKEGNLIPGYYGFRGFDLMCDYLVEEFGELLKRRAVKDRVIAGRGAAAFIQCVLVAELAVRLIRDDMGVSENKAREIMEESKAVGEMLHDEAVGDE
ncbi:hypothetical protein CDD80_7501 [Ophiocordyceps camponoti-rufipedis]|uniref:Restriction of telomere capping protein 4 n=1 Tax=Ophiocordyceps camponoti-rufipedis TaxID=2004952 RepID=A0A2C5ZDW6_9HYPO|nr:hypothetical protein CDD80_7501 [Ophiocordyceps camponoti-rufipedis]